MKSEMGAKADPEIQFGGPNSTVLVDCLLFYGISYELFLEVQIFHSCEHRLLNFVRDVIFMIRLPRFTRERVNTDRHATYG